MRRFQSRRTTMFALGAVIFALLGCGGGEPASPNSGVSLPDLAESEQLLAEFQPELEAVSVRVDELFALIASNDSATIHSRMTSPRFRELVTAEQFAVHCERIQRRLGRLVSKEPQSARVNFVEGRFVVSASYRAQFERGTAGIAAGFEQRDGEWRLLHLNMDAPEMLDAAGEYRESIRFSVSESDPVPPETIVDVYRLDADPPVVVLTAIRVSGVSWKVAGPFETPASPASGSVILDLTLEEAERLHALTTGLAVRVHAPVDVEVE